MGWGALHRGRLAEAERAFRRTLALAEKSGNPHWVATSLAVLANALAQSDRLAEAFDLFTEARAIHPASRAENFIISDVETVARWFAGDFPGALAIAEEMVARNRTGLSRRQLACSTFAALAAVELDRLSVARRYLDAARSTFGRGPWIFFREFCDYVEAGRLAGGLTEREAPPPGSSAASGSGSPTTADCSDS